MCSEINIKRSKYHTFEKTPCWRISTNTAKLNCNMKPIHKHSIRNKISHLCYKRRKVFRKNWFWFTIPYGNYHWWDFFEFCKKTKFEYSNVINSFRKYLEFSEKIRYIPRIEDKIGQNCLFDDFPMGKPSKLKSKVSSIFRRIPVNTCCKHFIMLQYHILPLLKTSIGTLIGVAIRVRLSLGKKENPANIKTVSKSLRAIFEIRCWTAQCLILFFISVALSISGDSSCSCPAEKSSNKLSVRFEYISSFIIFSWMFLVFENIYTFEHGHDLEQLCDQSVSLYPLLQLKKCSPETKKNMNTLAINYNLKFL